MIDALRRQAEERGEEQLAFLLALYEIGRRAGREQVADDERLVEVVYRSRERSCIQPPIVAQDVFMEESNRDALAGAVAIKLRLPGAGEAGVDEQDQILAG